MKTQPQSMRSSSQSHGGKPAASIMREMITSQPGILKQAMAAAEINIDSPPHTEVKYFATEDDALCYAMDHPKSPISYLPDTQMDTELQSEEVHSEDSPDSQSAEDNDSSGSGNETDGTLNVSEYLDIQNAGAEEVNGLGNTDRFNDEVVEIYQAVTPPQGQTYTVAQPPIAIAQDAHLGSVKQEHRDAKKRTNFQISGVLESPAIGQVPKTRKVISE